MDQWVLPGVELVKARKTLEAAVLIENAVQALLRKGADAGGAGLHGNSGCAGRPGESRAAREVRGQHAGFGASLCRLVAGEPREAGDDTSPGHARLNTVDEAKTVFLGDFAVRLIDEERSEDEERC